MTTDLHMTTGDRLRLVADHIEAHTELWDQSQWTAAGADVQPATEAGLGECDTPHCVAGWAVRFTPADQLGDESSWRNAGRAALGLGPDLAQAIFAGGYAPRSMPDVLRLIAGLPEGGRTLRAAIAAGLHDLTGTDLYGANLTRTNLTGTDLTGTDLTRAYLSGTNLDGAYLTRTDLTGTDLYGANLSGTDLTGANLSRANLSRADLTDANLTDANLTDARADEWTRLPAGWAVRDDGKVVPDE